MYQPLYLLLFVFAVNALPIDEHLSATLADEQILPINISNEQRIPVAIENKPEEELNQKLGLEQKDTAAEPEKIEEDKSDLSGSESAWGWGGWRGGWSGWRPGYYGGWRRSWNYPRYFNNEWQRSGYWG